MSRQASPAPQVETIERVSRGNFKTHNHGVIQHSPSYTLEASDSEPLDRAASFVHIKYTTEGDYNAVNVDTDFAEKGSTVKRGLRTGPSLVSTVNNGDGTVTNNKSILPAGYNEEERKASMDLQAYMNEKLGQQRHEPSTRYARPGASESRAWHSHRNLYPESRTPVSRSYEPYYSHSPDVYTRAPHYESESYYERHGQVHPHTYDSRSYERYYDTPTRHRSYDNHSHPTSPRFSDQMQRRPRLAISDREEEEPFYLHRKLEGLAIQPEVLYTQDKWGSPQSDSESMAISPGDDDDTEQLGNRGYSTAPASPQADVGGAHLPR